MSVAVYIATTEGPVRVERITRETAARSVICLGRTTTVLPISVGYDRFVSKPSGVIEREFGPHPAGTFRLDVGAQIHNGDSWQLGAFAAHALDAVGRLGGAETRSARAIWCTGRVLRDLRVEPVSHIAEKIKSSAALFTELGAAGTPIDLFLHPDNARDVASDTLADEVRIIPVTTARDMFVALGLRFRRSKPARPGHRLALRSVAIAAAAFAGVMVAGDIGMGTLDDAVEPESISISVAGARVVGDAVPKFSEAPAAPAFEPIDLDAAKASNFHKKRKDTVALSSKTAPPDGKGEAASGNATARQEASRRPTVQIMFVKGKTERLALSQTVASKPAESKKGAVTEIPPLVTASETTKVSRATKVVPLPRIKPHPPPVDSALVPTKTKISTPVAPKDRASVKTINTGPERQVGSAVRRVIDIHGYRQLPPGTMLDYGAWKCVVKTALPFEEACRGQNGELIRTYGKLIPVGQMPREGRIMGPRAIACERSYIAWIRSIDVVELSDDAQESLRGLWPLAVGKSVKFERRLLPEIGEVRTMVRVAGKGTAVVQGRKRQVFLINGETRDVDCGPVSSNNMDLGVTVGFNEVWWYAPDLGTVVHYEIKWQDGVTAMVSPDLNAIHAPQQLADFETGPSQPNMKRTASPTRGADHGKRRRSGRTPPDSGEFRPLPAGTILDYGSWACRMEWSSGYTTNCYGLRNESVSFYGLFVPVGQIPGEPYGPVLSSLQCQRLDGLGAYLRDLVKISLDEYAMTVIRGFWPLTVGKKVSFVTHASGLSDQAINWTLAVSRMEYKEVMGDKRLVYRIDGVTEVAFDRDCIHSDKTRFESTWWYDPLSRAIVRFSRKQVTGQHAFQDRDYELKQIVRPQISNFAPRG